MRVNPRELGASVAVIAIVTSLVVIKTSETIVNDSGTVLVVPVKSISDNMLSGNSTYVPAAEAANPPTAALAASNDRDQAPTNSDVVNQLSESIANEDKDLAWGSAVENDVNSLLSGIPFLRQQRSLTCGTIRCEVSLKLPSDISLPNMEYVLDKLYLLPSGNHQYPFIVEGVFPVDEKGSPEKVIRVIYMRHSS